MIKLAQKKRLALVLSGGGIKAAAFHIGVCTALREKGFRFAGGSVSNVETSYADDNMTFKIYVGSSAGAVVSTFLAAGFSVDSIVEAFSQGSAMTAFLKFKKSDGSLRPINYRDIFALNLKASDWTRVLLHLFKKKPVISGGIEVLLKRGVKVNGLFTTRNIEKYLRTKVYPENDFAALGVQLYVVATQLNHSRKVIFGNFPETIKNKDIKYAGFAKVSEAVAASAALPPFFAPYGITNEQGQQIYYFDGEIRDTLSTHVAAEKGADLVISSYSIQPYHYHAEMGSLHEYGFPIIFNQALYQTVQQKIERHIKHQKDVKAMIKAVDGYLKEAKIAEEHRQKLIEILMSRTNFNPKVDYLYIHPSPHDYEMFFYDHFSLNPTVLGHIIRTGFKAAMNALRPLI